MGERVQSIGWGLREAIRRTVDPDMLANCIDAERKWRTVGSSRSAKRGTHQISGNTEATAQAVENEFRRYLLGGRLVAWGRSASLSVELRSIPSSTWTELHFESFRQSIITEATAARAPILDVRIYPVVEAPDAVEYLHGKTVVEAFEQFVFGDPQCSRLRKRALAAGGHPLDLEPHQPMWRVDHGKEAGWISPVGWLNRSDNPQAYNRTCNADYILGQRFARLVGYLADGTLVAHGMTRDGRMAEIPRSLWKREHARLDLTNGDFLDFLPNARTLNEAYSRPRFLGLMLRKPVSLLAQTVPALRASASEMFHVDHTASVGIRQATSEKQAKVAKTKNRPRRKSERVLAAIRKAGIDLDTCELGPKEIAGKIQNDLSNPPTTKEGWDALAKMIGRLRAAKRSSQA
jgi:hypothetical protein